MLQEQYIAGEQQPVGKDGPTLDQCLVLPSGIELKIGELLSVPHSESGGEREVDGGVGKNGGVGEDDQVVASSYGSNSLGKEGGASDSPISAGAKGGGGGGRTRDDRAIISIYDFEVRVLRCS